MDPTLTPSLIFVEKRFATKCQSKNNGLKKKFITRFSQKPNILIVLKLCEKTFLQNKNGSGVYARIVRLTAKRV